MITYILITLHYSYIYYSWRTYLFIHIVHIDQDVDSKVNMTEEAQPKYLTQDTHNGMLYVV